MNAPPRDLSVSNLAVQDRLVADTIVARRMVSTKNTIGIRYNPTSSLVTYVLPPPSSSLTNYKLEPVVNMTLNLVWALPSSPYSQIGDTINLILQTDATGVANMHYSPSDFFLTACGIKTVSEAVTANRRFIRRFTFDGEIWVNTDDNC